MLAGDGRFCGGHSGCRKCLELQPAQWPVSIDEWRSMFGDLLETCGQRIRVLRAHRRQPAEDDEIQGALE